MMEQKPRVVGGIAGLLSSKTTGLFCQVEAKAELVTVRLAELPSARLSV
jgi:hypothetical protein